MSLELEQRMARELEGKHFGLPQVDPWQRRHDESAPKPVAALPAPAERDILYVASEDRRTFLDQRITLFRLLQAVSDATGISTKDIKGERRSTHLVEARHVFFWMARQYTAKSFPYIGRMCGNRDHSTVHHGANKVNDNLEKYRDLIGRATMNIRVKETWG